jgi:diadenylate cyclase
VLDRLDALPTDQVRDPASFALALGLLGGDDLHVSPRGYRMLDRVPKMPSPVVERLVARFVTLSGLLTASLKDLEAVEGVGEARAREIRTALSRQVETSVLQRFD